MDAFRCRPGVYDRLFLRVYVLELAQLTKRCSVVVVVRVADPDLFELNCYIGQGRDGQQLLASCCRCLGRRSVFQA